MKKINLLLLITFVLFVCIITISVSSVTATYTTFGRTNQNQGTYNYQYINAEGVTGNGYSNASLNNEDWFAKAGCAYMKTASGTSNVKFLLFNSSKICIAVSDPVTVSTSWGWYNAPFNDEVLKASKNQWFYIAATASAQTYLAYDVGGVSYAIYRGADNWYTSSLGRTMADLYIGADSTTEAIYMIISNDPAPTPTPTASPAPTATIAPYYDVLAGFNTFWANYGNALISLIIILVVSIICGYFGHEYGFLAGLTISTILIYATLGTAYMPLYGVVGVLVVDGLVLLGKSALHR